MKLSPEAAQEVRDSIIRMVNEANEDEVRHIGSCLHMGMQVCQMIDSLTVAKDRMVYDGIDPDNYAPMAVNQVTHQDSGTHYQISVRMVGEDECARFAEQMANATELGDGITRH